METKTPSSPEMSIRSKDNDPQSGKQADLFTFDANGTIKGVSRDGLLTWLTGSGFQKFYTSENKFIYVRIVDNRVHESSIPLIRDFVKEYVYSLGDLKRKGRAYNNDLLKEIFLKNNINLMSDSFLGHLPTVSRPFLADTATEAFFPFKNHVQKVTAEGLTEILYSDIDKLIWATHIIDREFIYNDAPAVFESFIRNVSNNEDDRFLAFITAIGYLLHNYKLPTQNQAVVAYDEELSERGTPSGGTGKSLMLQAVGKLKNVTVINGKQYDTNKTFANQQITQSTQIVGIDDVKPNFDFSSLNSHLTDSWTVEQKYNGAFTFDKHRSPKTYITSNTVLKTEGTSSQRRQFVLEFAPFYSNLIKQGHDPIVHTHGHVFFDQWDAEEWGKFDTFMLSCVKIFLHTGLSAYTPRNISRNKILQLTNIEFVRFLETKENEFKNEFVVAELFDEFKSMHFPDDPGFKQNTFVKWLKMYALSIGKEYKTRRSSSVNYGRIY